MTDAIMSHLAGETFAERAIRLLQEKSVRENKRKLSCDSIIKDLRLPYKAVIEQQFGSVDNYIRAAGLYPAFKPSRDDLIRSLREFYDAYGHPPRVVDAHEGRTIYGRDLYVKGFGSWNQALEAAGLPTIKAFGGRRKAIDADTEIQNVIKEIRTLYGTSGIIPTVAEHNQNSAAPHKASYYIKVVGTWRRLGELTDLRMACESPRISSASRLESTSKAQSA